MFSVLLYHNRLDLSELFCYNASKQVLFADAEASEDFSQAFDCSGSQTTALHTREN